MNTRKIARLSYGSRVKLVRRDNQPIESDVQGLKCHFSKAMGGITDPLS